MKIFTKFKIGYEIYTREKIRNLRTKTILVNSEVLDMLTGVKVGDGIGTAAEAMGKIRMGEPGFSHWSIKQKLSVMPEHVWKLFPGNITGMLSTKTYFM